jgi:rubredoxin
MELPKFTSKEELIEHLSNNDLSGIDAEYSKSTLRLVKKFKAKGAHLNKWWVMTPSDWMCPSCKRKKSEIVRLNRHGYLTCQLHEHHDHMKDLVKKVFTDLSSSKKVVVADEMAEKFAIKMSFSLSAYDNTVICSDCNGADTNAKSIAKTHPDFSFSPKEIGDFVVSKPNEEHKVNKEVAVKIWNEGKAIFNLRIKMVNYIANIAAENNHWYQPSEQSAKETERIAGFWFRRYGLLDIDHSPEKLLYNPVVFKGKLSSWRYKNNSSLSAIPTDGELQHLISTRGNFWKKVSDNWECPCCGRLKFDCIRPSQNNPWVFEVKNMLFFNLSAERWAENVLVCNDCSVVANQMGLEAAAKVKEISFPSSLISFVETMKIVIPRPHSLHNINNEIADNLIFNLAERIEEDTFHLSESCNREFRGKINL